MKHIIEDYKAIPGEHCGSTAMKNLVNHYTGSDFTESEIFGFGSGLGFMYIEHENFAPGVFINGRSISMEVDIGKALGIDYREEADFDNDHAWEVVKEEVLNNRPTMLSGDAFYLDYRDFKDHFPSHRFVLVGFNDEKQEAVVSDRIEAKFDVCSYKALKESRNPANPMSTFNLWGKFYSTEITHSLEQAHLIALKGMVDQMLGKDSEKVEFAKAFLPESCIFGTGLAGIKLMEESFSAWREKENWETVLKFTTNAVEKYGSGGGNFRNLYVRYLKSMREAYPDLVKENAIDLLNMSAGLWKEFANGILLLTSDSKESEWGRMAAMLSEIYHLESEAIDIIAVNI